MPLRLRFRRPATGVSRALRARVSLRVCPKTGASDGVSHGVSLGPFGPRAPECPKSVLRVCPQSVTKVSRTLWGHFRDTFGHSGARGPKGPRDTPWELPCFCCLEKQAFRSPSVAVCYLRTKCTPRTETHSQCGFSTGGLGGVELLWGLCRFLRTLSTFSRSHFLLLAKRPAPVRLTRKTFLRTPPLVKNPPSLSSKRPSLSPEERGCASRLGHSVGHPRS